MSAILICVSLWTAQRICAIIRAGIPLQRPTPGSQVLWACGATHSDCWDLAKPCSFSSGHRVPTVSAGRAPQRIHSALLGCHIHREAEIFPEFAACGCSAEAIWALEICWEAVGTSQSYVCAQLFVLPARLCQWGMGIFPLVKSLYHVRAQELLATGLVVSQHLLPAVFWAHSSLCSQY